MASKYTALLDEGLAKLGLDFDQEQRQQLDAYIAEIELFNPVYKLVGAEGEDRLRPPRRLPGGPGREEDRRPDPRSLSVTKN